MAARNFINQKPFNTSDDDDDDTPLVFKRNSSTPSKSSLLQKSSQKHDGSLGRPVSGAVAFKDQNSNRQEGKLVVSTKISAKPKNSFDRSMVTEDSEKGPVNKPVVEQHDSLDDSDDDKPLSFRMRSSSTVPRSNSSQVSKELKSPTLSSRLPEMTKPSVKSSDDGSEDEKPLAHKFSLKSIYVGGASNKNAGDDFDEEKKPLSSKFQQNGYGKRDLNGELPSKASQVLKKRPLDQSSSSGQSLSVKKVKQLDSSLPANVKKEKVIKAESVPDDEDNIPISQRIKKTIPPDHKSLVKKVSTKVVSSSFKKATMKLKKATKQSKYSKSTKVPPSSGEGQKWTTLEHSGVIFPPPYKPHGVKMLYNGQPIYLTPEQEEVATMFAVMKDTEYATKPKFIENFMNDWKVVLGRNHEIKKFERCDFTPIYEWHQKEKEKKKQMSTEEKKVLKEEKLKQEEKYMWAIVDGLKEKVDLIDGLYKKVNTLCSITSSRVFNNFFLQVGNFRVEPPGLFRGRGEHPKMGKLKRRIFPKDITINIGKDAPIPECPIPGQRWKEIKHDNTVTWLAFWNDPINPKEFKYVFLAASSSLKGQSDKEKYEKARMLKSYIHGIRARYTKDFTHKDVAKRQIAVATYLIDKLALRAGNEKDDDEADTVGCCTLKFENVTLVPPNSIQFDFLGKDSIRYFNTVEVELPVYKAIGQFKTGKKDGDDLFDQLDTSKLNAHLKELMPGLTAKVFRTYNASITLDDQLQETKDGNVAEKIAVYQHANKEVAIICNHQRSVSKSHSAQMSRLGEKMAELKKTLEELKVDLSRAKKGKPPLKDADGKPKKNLAPEMIEKKIAQTNAKIEKMELDMKIKEDLKTVALGTSKINYLDPRISVAWCKRHEVPIEKIFNKSLLAKFAWSMDVDPDFRF